MDTQTDIWTDTPDKETDIFTDTVRVFSADGTFGLKLSNSPFEYDISHHSAQVLPVMDLSAARQTDMFIWSLIQ